MKRCSVCMYVLYIYLSYDSCYCYTIMDNFLQTYYRILIPDKLVLALDNIFRCTYFHVGKLYVNYKQPYDWKCHTQIKETN